MLFLTIAMTKIDQQVRRQAEFDQVRTGLGDIFGMVVRRFAATHDDMSKRITGGLINGHLSLFIGREKQMFGARGADSVDGYLRVAVGTVFKSHRAGERR